MLNVLLESRAPRVRRMRITVASALAHAALIAGAVSLTTPGAVKATSVPPPDITYIAPPLPPDPPTPAEGSPRRDRASLRPEGPSLPVVPVPRQIFDVPPPSDDVGPIPPTDHVVIGGGIPTDSPIGGGSRLGGEGSAIDEHLVDRAPRLLGQPVKPVYPGSLRDAGVQGRVVVQFVVDTLGRAELSELQVVETPHPLFVDAVRSALARNHFSVGEAGGRKVRTRVQIPFDFTLER